MVTATQDLKNLVDHHRAQVDRAAQTNAKILCRKLREAGIMVESWRDYMGGVVLKGGTAEMLDWNDDLVETEFQDVVNLHCWDKLDRMEVPRITDRQWELLVELSEFIDYAVKNGNAYTGEFSCI